MTDTERKSMTVQCPDCGAGPHRYCRTDQGHPMLQPHTLRVEAIGGDTGLFSGGPMRTLTATEQRVLNSMLPGR